MSTETIEAPMPQENTDNKVPRKDLLDIALNNCKLIYDPKNTMDREMLCAAIDSGELIRSRITLVSFII